MADVKKEREYLINTARSSIFVKRADILAVQEDMID